MSSMSQTDGWTFFIRVFCWTAKCINYHKLSRSWSSKTLPNHCSASTTMFDHVLPLHLLFGFFNRCSKTRVFEKFLFCLINPENIFLKVPETLTFSRGETSFCVASGFIRSFFKKKLLSFNSILSVDYLAKYEAILLGHSYEILYTLQKEGS